jgi:hypothetical protein
MSVFLTLMIPLNPSQNYFINTEIEFDSGNSGNRKFKRGYGDACGGVWWSLHFAGVWNQAVSFVLVLLAGI